MPIHDWTKVRAGTFHHFHLTWISRICAILNDGLLPEGYYALAEQRTGVPEPDVLALQLESTSGESSGNSGIAVADHPPQVAFTTTKEIDHYARRANRIVIYHRDGDIVALIEIVSPGNKSSRNAIRSFIEKLTDIIEQGKNLLVIDLFPPSSRDPQGIHKAVWDEIEVEPFELPPNKRLTLASYRAGEQTTAYVQPVAVGEPLPDMPLFLNSEHYVSLPLEKTYQNAWAELPLPYRRKLESAIDQ